jgi:hypothetical protein
MRCIAISFALLLSTLTVANAGFLAELRRAHQSVARASGRVAQADTAVWLSRAAKIIG